MLRLRLHLLGPSMARRAPGYRNLERPIERNQTLSIPHPTRNRCYPCPDKNVPLLDSVGLSYPPMRMTSKNRTSHKLRYPSPLPFLHLRLPLIISLPRLCHTNSTIRTNIPHLSERSGGVRPLVPSNTIQLPTNQGNSHPSVVRISPFLNHLGQ